MSKNNLRADSLIETVVTCSECRHQNRLFKQAGQRVYRCDNCWHDLPSPFLPSSEQRFQALLRSDSSAKRIISISILTILATFGLFTVLHRFSREDSPSPSSAPISSLVPTASPTLSVLKSKPKSKPKSKHTLKPKPVLGPTDDHGVPFPAKSGYIKGYKPLRIGGYSSVTVDNSQNDSNVFVKLFTLDTKPPKAASVFFIRAHDSFTVSDIQPGNYDVRYRDLSSGGLSRTEPFNLKEVRTAGGVNFSRITMTLYKVQNGNMQTETISEAEF